MPHGINTPMRHARDLTEKQWRILAPLIPKPRRRCDGQGAPCKSLLSVMKRSCGVFYGPAPLRPICPSDTPRFRPVMGVFRLANAQDEQNCKSTNVNRHEQERSSGDQVSKLPLSTRATAIAVPGSGAAVGVPRLLTEVIQHGTAPSAP